MCKYIHVTDFGFLVSLAVNFSFFIPNSWSSLRSSVPDSVNTRIHMAKVSIVSIAFCRVSGRASRYNGHKISQKWSTQKELSIRSWVALVDDYQLGLIRTMPSVSCCWIVLFEQGLEAQGALQERSKDQSYMRTRHFAFGLALILEWHKHNLKVKRSNIINFVIFAKLYNIGTSPDRHLVK